MEFKKITAAEVKQLAEIHKRSFTKDHFTAFFPHSLLTKYLYQLVSENEFNFALYNDSNQIVGFIIAGTKSAEAVKKITQQNILLIFVLLLLHPNFLFEKLSDLISVLSNQKFNSPEKLRIYLIEVNELHQGLGIGKVLLEQFDKFLSSQNITSYGLSVRKSNSKAVRFYEKNSFKVEYSDKKSVYFIKKI